VAVFLRFVPSGPLVGSDVVVSFALALVTVTVAVAESLPVWLWALRTLTEAVLIACPTLVSVAL
jgi:hypothetical protein